MAVAPLKRGRAVVWLPPRSDGERAFGTEAHLLAFRGGQVAGSAIEKVSLDGLAGTTQVQLIFDARDVMLLMPEVPMLSGARLAQAVPNIVEDSLLQDAASCAFVIGPPLDSGRRLIAVIDRAWLEFTVGAFERRGMKVRAAWPAQLTLPWRPGIWSIGCVRGGISLRTGPLQGLGWGASDDVDLRTESVVALLEAAMAGGDRPEGLAHLVEDSAQRGSVVDISGEVARGGALLFGGREGGPHLPLSEQAVRRRPSLRQGDRLSAGLRRGHQCGGDLGSRGAGRFVRHRG
jgi:general secretion pathway protein L